MKHLCTEIWKYFMGVHYGIPTHIYSLFRIMEEINAGQMAKRPHCLGYQKQSTFWHRLEEFLGAISRQFFA